MLKSLYFKIVLILLIFIVAVMAAVGAILLNGVTSFYMDDFAAQMTECFEPEGFLMRDLTEAARAENAPSRMFVTPSLMARFLTAPNGILHCHPGTTAFATFVQLLNA